jgi:S1-C subfamily serine protease
MTHQEWDLAIVDFPESKDILSNQRHLIPRPENEPLRVGEKIKLMGFPNFTTGSTLTVREGEIVRFQPLFNLDMIIISAWIIDGNSGGPVLDMKNRVIGIAARGGKNTKDIFAAIPLKKLNDFKNLSR